MPEDNKLLVPPFSKKEVKAIAVEGVNEGIADGKIDIPAGGTKLYKHDIVFQFQGDLYQYKTTIIAADKTSLAFEESYRSVTLDMVNSPSVGRNGPSSTYDGAILFGKISHATYGANQLSATVLYKDNGDLTLSDLVYGNVLSELTDTITEL